MFDESPKRFDRIVAILIQLQGKRVVRAQEMADRFGVSLRTIYRDIRTLEASGVPLYGEAGAGYSIVDGYRLPPVMFTREEATGFLAAEKLMQHFSDRELAEHFASALFKVKAVLRSDEKDLLDTIDDKVLVRERPEHFQNAPNALATVFRSISEKRQVVLDYEAMAASGPSERTIEPVGIFHENQYWYVFGYCHLRNDYRQFRTDRIHRIALTDAAFALEHDALEHYIGHTDRSDELIEIKLEVDTPVAKYLKYDRHHYGFVSETTIGPKTQMTFLSRDPDNGFARWFLMFADVADIVSPPSVRNRVAELLSAGLDRLKK